MKTEGLIMSRNTVVVLMCHHHKLLDLKHNLMIMLMYVVMVTDKNI
jgi:hypothetical protein